MARGKKATVITFDALAELENVKLAVATGDLTVRTDTMTRKTDDGREYSESFSYFVVNSTAGSDVLVAAQAAYSQNSVDDVLTSVVEGFFSQTYKRNASQRLNLQVQGPDKKIEAILNKMEEATQLMGISFDREAQRNNLRAQLGLTKNEDEEAAEE